MTVQTDTKHTQRLPGNSPHCRSEHRFGSAGTSLLWHQNTAAREGPGQLCRWHSSALQEEMHFPAFPLGAIPIPPPQGYDLLPRHSQPDYHKGQITPQRVKQNPLYIIRQASQSPAPPNPNILPFGEKGDTQTFCGCHTAKGTSQGSSILHCCLFLTAPAAWSKWTKQQGWRMSLVKRNHLCKGEWYRVGTQSAWLTPQLK